MTYSVTSRSEHRLSKRRSEHDSQIRYLAIVSERPETLAKFYSSHFKMRELGRSDDGDVAVTDGFYNISILKRRDDGNEPALIILASPSTTSANRSAAQGIAPNSDIREEEGGLFHGDYRVTDPSGQSVTLSTHQFHTPIVERTFPCIRHLAVCVPNNDDVLNFYVNVFGFRESTTSRRIRSENRVVRWAADGATAMAILPDRTRRDMNREKARATVSITSAGW